MRLFELALITGVTIAAVGMTSIPSVAQEQEPRFMLSERMERAQRQEVKGEKTETPPDFSWAALARDPAARGENPRVGDSKYSAYYDFRDGLAAPVYFEKSE